MAHHLSPSRRISPLIRRVFFAGIGLAGLSIPAARTPPLAAAHAYPALVAHQLLNRHVSSAATGTLGAVTSSKDGTVAVALSLKLRDEAGLQRLIEQLYDPKSSQYRHFLTPEQFASRFGPAASDLKAINSWLQTRHLVVAQRFRNGLQLTVRGSARAVASAFGAQVDSGPGGLTRVAVRSRAVAIPAALQHGVLLVSGLTRQQPLQHVSLHMQQLLHDGSSPNGIWPSDLGHAYDVAPLYTKGITGKGGTIALVQFNDYSTTHLKAYDHQFGLHTATVRVPVSDGVTSGAPLDDGTGGESECEMDIELVHAIAPQARVLVYEAPNTDDGHLSVLNQIISDNKAQIISTSWGLAEIHKDPGTIQAEHQVYENAAALGIAVFAASGDNGAYDAAEDPSDPHKTSLMVDYPASDPYVTGVGGTSLSFADSGAYAGETVWADGSDPDNPIGSGGGISTVFARPKYQSGPGVNNQYSTDKRQVPDVASNADPNSGYAIYTTVQGVTGWHVAGGTSASTPIWAGYAVLLNQYVGHRIGFLNPTLYRVGRKLRSLPIAPFHDITSGNNLYYPATIGWDFTSGWGSFDAAHLAADIKFTEKKPATANPSSQVPWSAQP